MNEAVRAFARKEFVELLRDRKAIFLSFLFPILVYPLLFSFMSGLERKEEAKTEAAVFRIALTGEAELFRAAIEASEGLEVASDATDPALLENAIHAKEIDAWLDVPEVAAGAGEVLEITLRFHGPHERSSDARTRLVELLEELRVEERERRYRAAGGERPLGEILAVSEVDVATEEEAGGASAGRLLPYLLVITLFAGAASLSVDVVAGEKERGTLETLYLTPVSREVIARSKLLLVTAATIVTGGLNIVSMLICYRFGLIDTGPGAETTVVPIAGVALSLLLVLPLAILVAGVVLGISAYARTVKEAQYYMTPAMLLALVPGLMASSQGVRLDGFTALLPVANVALAVRDSLMAAVPGHLFLLVCGASVAWGLLAMRWTARILAREETILGFDPEPMFAKTPTGRRRAALLGMALTVLIYFYFGTQIQMWNTLPGLAINLWILLPALGALTVAFAWSGGELRSIVSWRPTSPARIGGAILLGAGTVVPMFQGIARLQQLFLPSPEGLGQGLEEDFASVGMPVILLLVAFSPGVCEEIVFRGAFLGLLRRIGPTRGAVLISSAYFALIHLSVFRFVPTFLLGVIMALLTVGTRSIFPAMVYHMTYNGLAVGLGQLGEDLPPYLHGFPAWAGSLLLLALGLWLVRRRA